MAWRVAHSLETLRDQLNAAHPDRSRASDGTIGDAAHQAQVSDHNPDASGVVRALDVTHDPAHGCDIDQLSDDLVASRDDRISYVIANGMITGPEYGWVWTAYDGDDPHTGHLHLSVVGDSRADDQRPWSIADGGDVSARTDAVIDAWRQGNPVAQDGSQVEPVKWRVRDEAWQRQTSAALATLTERPGVALGDAQLSAIADLVAARLGDRLADAVADRLAARLSE
jgi:hypothetical protein